MERRLPTPEDYFRPTHARELRSNAAVLQWGNRCLRGSQVALVLLLGAGTGVLTGVLYRFQGFPGVFRHPFIVRTPE